MGDRADLKRPPLESSGAGPEEDPNKQLLGQMSRIQVQMFPLFARRRQLQQFCDNYFNRFIPPTVAVFRPALPIVICTVLHYEELGTELMWKTGVMTQNELYFLVLLDRYREENGGLQFVEHCATTPYIFVDNSPSAIAGRERFGFPKQDSVFSTPLQGAPGTGAAERFLSVSSWVPTTSGHRVAPLLEIMREPSRMAGVSPDQSLDNPVIGPRGIDRFNPFWTAQTTFGELKARTDPGPPGELAGQWQELQDTLRDGAGLSVYNFRQFAHPSSRGGARYQDLIRFRMRVNGVQDMRLFSERYGPADYSLLLHRRAVVPIVDRLGLEVFSRQRGSVAEGRPTVDVMRTFLPMFGQADVELTDTRRLCWRFQRSGWFDDDHQRITHPTSVAFARYNDYLGPSAHAFTESQPTDPLLDQKLFMLPARAAVVKRYIDTMVPQSCPIAIEPITAGHHTAVRVLLSKSRRQRIGEQEELVWLDGNYASIAVPVTWSMNHKDAAPQQALLLLKDFTDNGFYLQALRELAAAPTDHGTFHAGDWFAATSDVAQMLSLDAMAIERNATEALLTTSRVFEIFSVDNTADRSALERYRLRDAVTGPLAELWPVLQNTPSVLSFGSICAPGNPYRAITRRLMLTHFGRHETVEVEPPNPGRSYYVHFHHTETYPLVEQLGLVALPVDAPLAIRLAESDRGRTATVPVLELSQSAVKTHLSCNDILWQELGHFHRGLPGMGSTAGGHDLTAQRQQEPADL